MLVLFDWLAWICLAWLVTGFWVFRGALKDWESRRARRGAAGSWLLQAYFVGGAIVGVGTLGLGIAALVSAGHTGAAALVGFLCWRGVALLRKRAASGPKA